MIRTRLFLTAIGLFASTFAGTVVAATPVDGSAYQQQSADCGSWPSYLGQNTQLELDIAEQVNYQRAQMGLGPLQLEGRLNAAAQKHAMNMACQHQMAHQLDGYGPGERISAEGYVWSAYAENVAMGYTSAQSVVAGWMNSPGHRANILDSSSLELSETGVGVFRGPDGMIYFCQVFARPGGK